MNVRRIVAAALSTLAILAVGVGTADSASANSTAWDLQGKAFTVHTSSTAWD